MESQLESIRKLTDLSGWGWGKKKKKKQPGMHYNLVEWRFPIYMALIWEVH